MIELSSTDQKAGGGLCKSHNYINYSWSKNAEGQRHNYYNAHREWAGKALQRNDLDSIMNKMNSMIDSEQLLTSI